MLPQFAGHGEQGGGCLLQFSKHAGQRIFRNRRIIAETEQSLALAFQLLNQIQLQIDAPGNVNDLKERQQRRMMFIRATLRKEIVSLGEQILQPQQRANPFAERIFVNNHALTGLVSRASFCGI